LETVRLDPSLADADEIAAARASLNSALQEFHDGMADDWFSARGMPLVDRDYVSFRNACSPRLDGTVVKIGPGQPFADIATALPNIKPGTLVWLGNGEFSLAEFGRQYNFNDLAIVGQGSQFTTLTGGRGQNVEIALRLLIDGVRVDCRDDPFTDVRGNGRMHFRDCLVEGYNSGAGGSNALSMTNGTLL
jgi:hypothetical protein